MKFSIKKILLKVFFKLKSIFFFPNYLHFQKGIPVTPGLTQRDALLRRVF